MATKRPIKKTTKKQEELKKRALDIVKALEDKYPIAECGLDFKGEPWKLMVMSRLSAQCTDIKVNAISQILFKRYPTPEALANADLQDVMAIIKPCGLYVRKAEDIISECQALVRDFGGVVPDDIDTLLTFKGIGRKIANLLVSDIYGKPAIVADTHCIRLSCRMGLVTPPTKNAEKVEKTLKGIIPEDKQTDFCHRLVMFGRECCKAPTPLCHACILGDNCPKIGVK